MSFTFGPVDTSPRRIKMLGKKAVENSKPFFFFIDI
jgi:hypothetical protein